MLSLDRLHIFALLFWISFLQLYWDKNLEKIFSFKAYVLEGAQTSWSRGWHNFGPLFQRNENSNILKNFSHNGSNIETIFLEKIIIFFSLRYFIFNGKWVQGVVSEIFCAVQVSYVGPSESLKLAP